MTDHNSSDAQTEMTHPDPDTKGQAEGEPTTRRPQDQGKDPGVDTANREPAEGGRDESDDSGS